MSFAPSRSDRLLTRCRCSSGYTLIEVLIAAAIFGAMVTLATMALDQGLKQYQGLMDKGLNFWDHARYIWIQRSFNSATDYYVYSRSDGWAPYFVGDRDVISYVSLAPLAGDFPVVVWLKSELENDGKRSLVYYELPVYAKGHTELERSQIFADYKKGNSLRLLQGLDRLELNFYGYDLALGRYMWSTGYDGQKKKLLPVLVKITHGVGESKNELIFGINVNSTLKMIYNDIQPSL